MLTIDKAVLLSEGEYEALKEAARMYREYRLTRKEVDAMIHAIRVMKISQAKGRTPKDKLDMFDTLVNLSKKLEGYRGNV